jgi:hypothetical protein
VKRDFDLIRDILLNIEQHQSHGHFSVRLEGRDEVEISLHLKWLHEAEFVDAYNLQWTTIWQVSSLTWKGCDYLDAVRDPGIWGKVRKKLLVVGGSATIDLVKALAQGYISQKLGLQA